MNHHTRDYGEPRRMSKPYRRAVAEHERITGELRAASGVGTAAPFTPDLASDHPETFRPLPGSPLAEARRHIRVNITGDTRPLSEVLERIKGQIREACARMAALSFVLPPSEPEEDYEEGDDAGGAHGTVYVHHGAALDLGPINATAWQLSRRERLAELFYTPYGHGHYEHHGAYYFGFDPAHSFGGLVHPEPEPDTAASYAPAHGGYPGTPEVEPELPPCFDGCPYAPECDTCPAAGDDDVCLPHEREAYLAAEELSEGLAQAEAEGDPLNPKDALAQREGKVQLNLLEPAALRGAARALEDGARKYGRRNYREVPVRESVYLGAIFRHLLDIIDGQDYAEDSGCRHLDHIEANVHILRGAEEAGTLVVDRENTEVPS